MLDLDEWFDTAPDANSCGCAPTFEDETLVIDATDCEGGGRLAHEPDCRATVIDTLTERTVDSISVRVPGFERVYEGAAAAFLSSAGRFVETVSRCDSRLATNARADPIAAGREAAGRADAVSDVARDVGLLDFLGNGTEYPAILSPYEGPTPSQWRVESAVPDGTELAGVRQLETGATVRRYTNDGPDYYHLEPLDTRLGRPALDLLAAAYERLAAGDIRGGDRAPARAVRAVLDSEGVPTDDPRTIHNMEEGPNKVESSHADSRPIEAVTRVLEKHTRGFGLLSDIFADSNVSDVFLTAPATTNRLRVTADGETRVTNIRPTDRCIEGLASRFRRESGRAFSRADPTLDATATVANRRVRVAGVTDPTSDGTAFAFRVQDRDVWTLPALVANGTLSASAAAFLSVAVERGSAILTAGPRGAGKTTLLGALLWELPPDVRTVVIEDTQELPVEGLQQSGRDVQALRTGSEGRELPPAEALRTALRLGNGALVVGEVRGEEAAVLYEAMRVGANSEAVLGTIHGDGGDDVYERVVSDLDVPPTSFGVTDLLVTLEQQSGGRNVRLIEEVVGDEEPRFEALFERSDDGLQHTGRIDRGASQMIASLATPSETYADIRDVLKDRERLVQSLADRATVDGEAVTASHSRR